MTSDQFLVLIMGVILVILAITEVWKPQFKAVI